MKSKIKKTLNDHYYRYLHKEKYRNKLNAFLFFLWKAVYRIVCLLPIDKKLVLFVANNDLKIPPEYESLNEYAIRQGYKTKFIFKSANTSDVIYKNELKKIVNDLKFQVSYARAKATFVYDYFLPCYANTPRKNTRLVQVWHACGAFKRWGYSIQDSEWGLKSNFYEKYNIHKTYTDIITSSDCINHIYAEAFGCSEEKVHAAGVPRTDIFFNEDFLSSQKDGLLKKHPELLNKTLVLYAPTFRGTDLRSAHNELEIDFLKLKQSIGNNFAILIKLHPHVAKAFSVKDLSDEVQDFVIDISKEFSISSALCFSDIVISDYSSLIFEYALFERPMIFYAYDLEEYDSLRSFYYPYEEFVPGRIVRNTEELSEAILDAENNFSKKTVTEFKNKFMSACDGNATVKVFKLAVR